MKKKGKFIRSYHGQERTEYPITVLFHSSPHVSNTVVITYEHWPLTQILCYKHMYVAIQYVLPLPYKPKPER